MLGLLGQCPQPIRQPGRQQPEMRQRLPCERHPIKVQHMPFILAAEPRVLPVRPRIGGQLDLVEKAQLVERLAFALVKILRGEQQPADRNRHRQFFRHFAHQRRLAGFSQFHPPAGQHDIIVLVLPADQHMPIPDGNAGDAIIEPPPAPPENSEPCARAHSASGSSNRLVCMPTNPCGTLIPRCWNAAPVSMRPRDVRWMKPCCSR